MVLFGDCKAKKQARIQGWRAISIAKTVIDPFWSRWDFLIVGGEEL
jgi:hypothetical protein